MHGVIAFAGGFDQAVVRCVDDIEVVAYATHQAVVADTTVQGVTARAAVQAVVAVQAAEQVGAAVAREHVVHRIARAAEVGAARQGQVFEIGGQDEGHAGLHGVAAFSSGLNNLIGQGVDDIGVIAGAAGQGVGTGPAVQGVVAGQAAEAVIGTVAGQEVVQDVASAVDGVAAGEREVLDLGSQRRGEAGQHRVYAGACGFHHHIARIVHQVTVVTQATGQAVCADAPIQRVVSVATGQGVVACAALQATAGAGIEQGCRCLVGVVGRQQGLGAPLPGQVAFQDLAGGEVQGIGGDDDFALVTGKVPHAAVAVRQYQATVEAQRLVDDGHGMRCAIQPVVNGIACGPVG